MRKNESELTAELFSAVRRPSRLEVKQILQAHSANKAVLNAIGAKSGKSVLHIAVETGDIELVWLLVHCGVNIYLENEDEKLAIEIAAKKNFDIIMAILIGRHQALDPIFLDKGIQVKYKNFQEFQLCMLGAIRSHESLHNEKITCYAADISHQKLGSKLTAEELRQLCFSLEINLSFVDLSYNGLDQFDIDDLIAAINELPVSIGLNLYGNHMEKFLDNEKITDLFDALKAVNLVNIYANSSRACNVEDDFMKAYYKYIMGFDYPGVDSNASTKIYYQDYCYDFHEDTEEKKGIDKVAFIPKNNDYKDIQPPKVAAPYWEYYCKMKDTLKYYSGYDHWFM
ncbi:ankyrin repeat domain-containing protein [Thiotrichales bacterium 19S9-12]|nr:ankyrin repeat domain-containing protein [Thiotrichales bacterium 19S9-11]MCF6811792.1 ankyrin repeat domain-containing protein [Thiotrichales bacterium 19S9-12]